VPDPAIAGAPRRKLSIRSHAAIPSADLQTVRAQLISCALNNPCVRDMTHGFIRIIHLIGRATMQLALQITFLTRRIKINGKLL